MWQLHPVCIYLKNHRRKVLAVKSSARLYQMSELYGKEQQRAPCPSIPHVPPKPYEKGMCSLGNPPTTGPLVWRTWKANTPSKPPGTRPICVFQRGLGALEQHCSVTCQRSRGGNARSGLRCFEPLKGRAHPIYPSRAFDWLTNTCILLRQTRRWSSFPLYIELKNIFFFTGNLWKKNLQHLLQLDGPTPTALLASSMLSFSSRTCKSLITLFHLTDKLCLLPAGTNFS